MFKRSVRICMTAAAFMLVTGCASVQMASPDKDIAAKSFAVKADKANIYVYRNESMGAAIKMPVIMDGKLIGDTAAKTYVKLEVTPGDHTMLSKAENESTLNLRAEAGKNYFVWQEVKMGVFSARSSLQLVDETAGRAGVQECKMIQSAFY